jgi:Fic family protein
VSTSASTPDGPRFTITTRAADLLVKIAEGITRLDLGTSFPLDVRLHRENLVRSIYSSLAIEGSQLTLDEVAAIMDGKTVRGRPQDIQEVHSAREAYAHLLDFNPFSVTDFLAAHGLMTKGLVDESGRFRAGDVAVYDAGRPIHIGARPQFVPELIAELFAWARECDLHPVLLSVIVHCEIETIHPVADGNGRMGRLWQTLILARWREAFARLPMESVVFARRREYYESLRQAQRANDATPFIEFTLDALLEVVEDHLGQPPQPASGGLNGGLNGGINGQEALVALLAATPDLTVRELATALDTSARTVERRLAALQAEGRLRREGSRKSGRWVVVST